MKEITGDSFKQDVLESKKIVLVDVWAPWCGPCRGMAPILDEIAEEIKDWAEVVKLNADEEMDLVEKLGVSGLPTFLIYKNGEKVGSSVGATTKSNLLSVIKQFA